MKRKILKHLTITGFAKREQISTVELLEKKLATAIERFETAKSDVANARQELDAAVELSRKKTESKPHELVAIRTKGDEESSNLWGRRSDEAKAIYEQALKELEEKKNEISKKIEGYKSDGSEKWEIFKNKLNSDLEKLGKEWRAFIQSAM